MKYFFHIKMIKKSKRISIITTHHILQVLVLATISFNLESTLIILLCVSSISNCRLSNILFWWVTSLLKFKFSYFIFSIMPPNSSKELSYDFNNFRYSNNNSLFYIFEKSRLDSGSSKPSKFLFSYFSKVFYKSIDNLS